MHPSVLLQSSDVHVSGQPVPAAAVRELPGYQVSSRGGRFCVAALAMRRRVKYEWATRGPGCAQAEIYRKCEFVATDGEQTACFPISVLRQRELLGDLLGLWYDDPEDRAEICDALYRFASKVLRLRSCRRSSLLLEVEVEAATLLSYDWVRWWCPVQCALPPAGLGHPIEALEMEVYAEEKEEEGSGAAAQCAICLEDFVAGAQVERLPCLHRFHGECLLQWLHKDQSCPLCRSEFRIK